MIPDLDWSNPAAVERYIRKIRRRDLLHLAGAVLVGLLPAAAFLVYVRFNPISEQQRRRFRDRLKDALNRPVTKGDLLAVLLGLVGLGFGLLTMAMLLLT